jgi:phosphomannomutase
VSDEIELKIETIMDGDLGKRLAKSADPGAKRTTAQDHIEFAKRTLPRKFALDGLRVVIDCAHGAAYQVAPDALWNWAPRSSNSASNQRASISTRLRLDQPAAPRPRCADARRSASRSTADRLPWSMSWPRRRWRPAWR